MVSQVVLGTSKDGHTDLRIDRVSSGSTGSKHDRHELHLGSQDLVRFADYAMRHGFKVASFIVADAYLSPLSRDENEELSGSMVTILAQFGGRELESAMRDEFDGLYIVGVNLIAKRSGKRIGVRRDGFIETSAVEQAEDLLRSAWRELHLS